jgi:hypothetical protein
VIWNTILTTSWPPLVLPASGNAMSLCRTRSPIPALVLELLHDGALGDHSQEERLGLQEALQMRLHDIHVEGQLMEPEEAVLQLPCGVVPVLDLVGYASSRPATRAEAVVAVPAAERRGSGGPEKPHRILDFDSSPIRFQSAVRRLDPLDSTGATVSTSSAGAGWAAVPPSQPAALVAEGTPATGSRGGGGVARTGGDRLGAWDAG